MSASKKVPIGSRHPIMVAIEIAGGMSPAAAQIGITKNALEAYLKSPLDEWPYGCLRKLSELSRVPLGTLTVFLNAPLEGQSIESFGKRVHEKYGKGLPR